MKKIVLVLCVFVLFATCAFAFGGKPSKSELRADLEEHSLVVFKNGEKSVFNGKGIKPLVDYLENDDFQGAYVADKIVGKASALLLVYGQVKEVYTPTISKSAVKVFKRNHVKYRADRVVDNIINRGGTDICPMEKKVQSINNPEEAYKMFKEMFENFTPASFQ